MVWAKQKSLPIHSLLLLASNMVWRYWNWLPWCPFLTWAWPSRQQTDSPQGKFKTKVNEILLRWNHSFYKQLTTPKQSFLASYLLHSFVRFSLDSFNFGQFWNESNTFFVVRSTETTRSCRFTLYIGYTLKNNFELIQSICVQCEICIL